MPDAPDPSKSPLYFKVLGRTLEHFGVQMYKRREVAIAELVANCWDAGASSVFIEVPTGGGYNPFTSEIAIRDTGCGMSHSEVQAAYLVLGRNRRKGGGEEVELPLVFDDQPSEKGADTGSKKRRVMGRKGIGKLAGFGLAKKMIVTTWQSGRGMEFYLDLDQLKLEDNDSREVPIQWQWVAPKTDLSVSGTIVTLRNLKHKTALDVDALCRSLARRFTRTVRGEMEIRVNGVGLPDPTPFLDKRDPSTAGTFTAEKLSDGSEVRYWYGFAAKPIHERELRGFAIMVNGKVAQAPPFFFEVEAKASGQHATKYVLGEIEADFVDKGCDDDSDIISTDRQELDWEAEQISPFKKWGEELVRRLLIECTKFKGEKTEQEVLANSGLRTRVERLDRTSRKQIRGFLRILGARDDDGRTLDLADALVRAYEFRQFHDVIEDIEEAAQDPHRLAQMLQQLHEWKVLESRAILEIIKGRLEILDKFEKMLCNDSPETASAKTPENMHDLLGGNPWLLNPEWQVLAEEKGITTQLREWGQKDLPDYQGRYDFLALSSEGLLVIIEIKRPDYPATYDEMSRLVGYQDKLSIAHNKPIRMVFICGRDPQISSQAREAFEKNPYFEIRYWNQVFDRTRKTYEHYRAILEGSVSDPHFKAKEEEIRRTRELLEKGIHRGQEERARGVPNQDVDYQQPDKPH